MVELSFSKFQVISDEVYPNEICPPLRRAALPPHNDRTQAAVALHLCRACWNFTRSLAIYSLWLSFRPMFSFLPSPATFPVGGLFWRRSITIPAAASGSAAW